MNEYLSKVLDNVSQRYSEQPEFVQAVTEFMESVGAYVDKHPELEQNAIMERIVEPDRTIIFRVPWVDDNNKVHVNRGYRVQFNNAIGPYKGGLRLHPSVNLSIIKFLGFEQIFKNSLTGIAIGGAKGGSDFDPKGKSDAEIMRFCQSFMSELYKHIGAGVDVPAGDIGVGAREIGYLFGYYKKLTTTWSGSFTGKGLAYGGSLARTEATGFGLAYFVDEYLRAHGDNFEGKRVLISGSGNVATYAAVKVGELGGRVVTMSDSNSTVYDENGIDIDVVKDIKEANRGRIREYADRVAGAKCLEGQRPWGLAAELTDGAAGAAADVALPCATQNEISADDARALAKGGVKLVAEGANMPTSAEAVRVLEDANVAYLPGKAANAGGVATSGLEMAQNSQGLSWAFDEVDNKLHSIMTNIYSNVAGVAAEIGEPENYVAGANIAGFKRVADAMLAQGIC